MIPKSNAPTFYYHEVYRL